MIRELDLRSRTADEHIRGMAEAELELRRYGEDCALHCSQEQAMNVDLQVETLLKGLDLF